jgi:hypothetical protein
LEVHPANASSNAANPHAVFHGKGRDMRGRETNPAHSANRIRQG